jgi:hypothetical protein
MVSTPAGPADPRDLRCSDADRERVADVLRQAAGDGRLDLDELEDRLGRAYAAKTYREFEPLLADLPVAGDGRLPVPRPTDAVAPFTAAQVPAPNRLVGPGVTPPETTTSLAIMSETKRTGAWVLPTQSSAAAFMGSVVLDLTDVRLMSVTSEIQASSVMGSVEVIVPDDVAVVTDGVAIMGAFDGPTEQAPAGVPVVRVTGFSLMGSVEVKRRKPKRKKGKAELPR